MPQSNYQEPIEKEDVDIQKKFQPDAGQPLAGSEKSDEKPKPTVEKIPAKKPAAEVPESEKISDMEDEISPEAGSEQATEKIETARKTIQTQKPATATVQDDAQMVAGIADYEKKIEKLVELALQRGPEHAIRIAQHMDAGDNYTMDELHDRMLEDDLRKQLIQKGLLKEL